MEFYINGQKFEGIQEATIDYETVEKEYPATHLYGREVSFSAELVESNLRVMTPKMRHFFKTIKCDGKLYL